MIEDLEKEFDEMITIDKAFLFEFGEEEKEVLETLKQIKDIKIKIAIMKLIKYYRDIGYDYGRTDHEFLDNDEEDEEIEEDEENEIKDDSIAEEEIPSNLR